MIIMSVMHYYSGLLLLCMKLLANNRIICVFIFRRIMKLLVRSPESPGKLLKQRFRRLVLTKLNFCDRVVVCNLCRLSFCTCQNSVILRRILIFIILDVFLRFRLFSVETSVH